MSRDSEVTSNTEIYVAVCMALTMILASLFVVHLSLVSTIETNCQPVAEVQAEVEK